MQLCRAPSQPCLALTHSPQPSYVLTHAVMTARPRIYSLRSSRRVRTGTHPHMDASANPDHDASEAVTTVFVSNLHCSRYAAVFDAKYTLPSLTVVLIFV